MAERKQKLSGKYRNKFLGILRLLNEESDVDNPLSTQEIIRKLGREGIAIDRRTLSREIDIMRANGILAEETKKGHQNAYFIRKNTFNEKELNMLIYALRAVSFVSDKDTESLVERLTRYGRQNKFNLENTELTCFNISKYQSHSLFDNIIALQSCINKGYKIKFTYFDTGAKGEKIYRQTGGTKKIYEEEPISLVFSDSRFYLLTQNQKYKKVLTYRVDRIDTLETVKEIIDTEKAMEQLKEFMPLQFGAVPEADRKELVSNYVRQSFKMYGGGFNNLTLSFPDYLATAVYEKFGSMNENGKSPAIAPDKDNPDKLCITVNVQTSNVFWGWVAQFGGLIKVKAPQKCVKEYRKFCEALLDDTI